MGVSSESFLVSLSLKDLVGGIDQENKTSYGSLWSKVVAAQAKKQRVVSKKSAKVRRPSRVLMKRRARLIEVSRRRRSNGIERRVRRLRRILPNGESMGLDGLFRETADYILSLQLRVRVMQLMVKVLTRSDDI